MKGVHERQGVLLRLHSVPGVLARLLLIGCLVAQPPPAAAHPLFALSAAVGGMGAAQLFGWISAAVGIGATAAIVSINASSSNPTAADSPVMGPYILPDTPMMESVWSGDPQGGGVRDQYGNAHPCMNDLRIKCP